MGSIGKSSTNNTNISKVKLPSGSTNLMQNGKRVGLIDSYGTEYRYEGTFEGIVIGETYSTQKPVYVGNLQKSYDVKNWIVKSVSKFESGRTTVTLTDPNNDKMSVTVEKSELKRRKK